MPRTHKKDKAKRVNGKKTNAGKAKAKPKQQDVLQKPFSNKYARKMRNEQGL
jgi:hypothetical protein